MPPFAHIIIIINTIIIINIILLLLLIIIVILITKDGVPSGAKDFQDEADALDSAYGTDSVATFVRHGSFEASSKW